MYSDFTEKFSNVMQALLNYERKFREKTTVYKNGTLYKGINICILEEEKYLSKRFFNGKYASTYISTQ